MLKFSANFHEVISSFERIHHVKKLGNCDYGNLCIPGLRTMTKGSCGGDCYFRASNATLNI